MTPSVESDRGGGRAGAPLSAPGVRLARGVLATVVALACVAGCDLLPGLEDAEPCPSQTPWLRPPDIATLPDTLSACGGTWVLGGDLWRDFMPNSAAGGDPLRAIVTLSECDSLAVPEGLRLTHLWVIGPQEYWSTNFNAEAVPARPHELSAIARCGPKWAPGITVDVIASVQCGGGALAYVRARGLRIARTD